MATKRRHRRIGLANLTGGRRKSVAWRLSSAYLQVGARLADFPTASEEFRHDPRLHECHAAMGANPSRLNKQPQGQLRQASGTYTGKQRSALDSVMKAADNKPQLGRVRRPLAVRSHDGAPRP